MKKIKIENTDIFFENFELGKGKITISNTYGYNYSAYWGAMSNNLEEFILEIDSNYFAKKLLGGLNIQSFDVKTTFACLRKFIKDELPLPWYKHLEFQKDLRRLLNEFQVCCEKEKSKECFIKMFDYYLLYSLDFSRIKNDTDRELLFDDFDRISDEPWHFIQTKESDECKWLKKLHKKIKKELKNKA